MSPNPQEIIDSRVRHLIGDLQVQLIFAQARIAELEQQLAMLTPKEGQPKANGLDTTKATHEEATGAQ